MVEGAGHGQTRAPLRALIVEDSEDDALLLLRELGHDYEVEHRRVDTPEEMRAALAKSSWDVVLSDYKMPRFGAPAALELVREMRPETPFFVVSGKVGEDVAVEATKAGAYDYVMKDNLARLCAAVERSMEEARERRDRKRIEQDLGRRDAILEAVRFAAERFLGEAGGWEESIEEVLKQLGKATQASRVYVFENHVGEDGEVWGTQRYEWVAEGISAQIDNPLMQTIPYKASGYGRWAEVLGSGEPVYGATRGFPEGERAELEAQDILSLAIVPIFVEGVWWGQIGFDECFSERKWSSAEMGALGAAAGTLGAAIKRRQIEERLRGSEERYRAVIEQATDGIYLLDAPTRRILETNPSFQKMLGYAEDELRGMEVYDFVAHSRENVDATIDRTLQQRRRVVGGRRYRRKDGSLLDVEVGVSVISHGGREVICTIVRDVTERNRREEALRQSERLYRAVLEQATENICLVDVETGCVVESNPAFRETLGYSEEELRRLTLYELVAHDRASVEKNMRRTLEAGRRFMGQRRYRRRDGSLLEVEVSASTILRDGRETFCVVAHDVSERARAQRLLEERVATLSRIASSLTLDAPVEETLRSLAESVMGASTATNYLVMLRDGRTEEIRLVGSHGAPEGYDEGLQAVFQAGVHSPVHEAVLTARPMMLRDTHDVILKDPLFAPVHRFAGEIPEDKSYILPLIFRGRAIGAIAFGYLPGREPTEDEEAFLAAVADQIAVAVENARLFAEARGKAALEERQRLARELHDSVSQALYGIALGARSTRDALEDGDPEGAAEPLEYVLSQTRAGLAEMRALIFELRPESLEKEGLVAALEKQAAAIEARHRIGVQTTLCAEPDLPPETKEALYRVAQEALHNAVKHAHASTVRITLEVDGAGITLEVSDDGVGFDPDGEFPGHLGLSSMRERASNLGGTLEVQSAPGTGARIRMWTPT